MTLSGKKAFSSVTLLLAERKKRTLWTVHIFPEKREKRPSSTIYFIDALVRCTPRASRHFFPSGRILAPEQDEKRHWGSKRFVSFPHFHLAESKHTHTQEKRNGRVGITAKDACKGLLRARDCSECTHRRACLNVLRYVHGIAPLALATGILPSGVIVASPLPRPSSNNSLGLASPLRPSFVPPSPPRPLPYVASGDLGRRNDLISFPSFCLFPIEISQDFVTLQGRLRQGSREG